MRFLAPRYWLIWTTIGILRVLVFLPFGLQRRLGRAIGIAARRFLRTRAGNAERNIALCLPELDRDQLAALVRAHFASLGEALVETAMAWWASDRRLGRLAQFEGHNHLENALRSGCGVLLLADHFTTLEIGARFLTLFADIDVVYQRFSNPLVEEILKRGRSAHVGLLIPNDRPLRLIRRLQSNRPVWYAPDQTYPHKNRVLAPFFSIPAMSNTTVSRIAKATGATVLPFFVKRLENGDGYRVIIEPPLEDFPSRDAVEDATRLNRIVERHVSEAPEQYLWIHRRFRAYDEDYPDYYSDAE